MKILSLADSFMFSTLVLNCSTLSKKQREERISEMSKEGQKVARKWLKKFDENSYKVERYKQVPVLYR